MKFLARATVEIEVEASDIGEAVKVVEQMSIFDFIDHRHSEVWNYTIHDLETGDQLGET